MLSLSLAGQQAPAYLLQNRGRETVWKRLLARDVPAEHEHEARQIEHGLEKTRRGLLDRLAGVFGPVDISEATWEALEDRLIRSDMGVATALDLVAQLREQASYVGVRRADELPRLLHTVMVRSLEADGAIGGGEPTLAGGMHAGMDADSAHPHVTLVVGVNGSGKTTSIAKLAYRYRAHGRQVVLVAADTFRAAAIDQLQIWGERVAVPVVASHPGGDPAAVVFDALSSSAGRSAGEVIIDTAGRLHTQANLMAELEKVHRVVRRVVPDGPHETLLVLDATTGQNGLNQAAAFARAVSVSGILLAKLDSSAKGGIAFAITRELGLPIRWVGTGEGLDDLAPFDAVAYANGVLGLPSVAATAEP